MSELASYFNEMIAPLAGVDPITEDDITQVCEADGCTKLATTSVDYYTEWSFDGDHSSAEDYLCDRHADALLDRLAEDEIIEVKAI